MEILISPKRQESIMHICEVKKLIQRKLEDWPVVIQPAG